MSDELGSTQISAKPGAERHATASSVASSGPSLARQSAALAAIREGSIHSISANRSCTAVPKSAVRPRFSSNNNAPFNSLCLIADGVRVSRLTRREKGPLASPRSRTSETGPPAASMDSNQRASPYEGADLPTELHHHGTSNRIRTCISRLSVATGYKPAVLPLNYRGILAEIVGFEPTDHF